MHRPFSKRSNAAWLWISLSVLVAVMLVGCSTNQTTPTVVPTSAAAIAAPYPAEISAAQVLAKRAAGAFILDVREPSEWNQVHIPGSMLIPLGQLQQHVTELPRDKEIVVVCHSGARSKAGRDIVKNADFTQVTYMTGGLIAWQAAGYPTVSGP